METTPYRTPSTKKEFDALDAVQRQTAGAGEHCDPGHVQLAGANAGDAAVDSSKLGPVLDENGNPVDTELYRNFGSAVLHDLLSGLGGFRGDADK